MVVVFCRDGLTIDRMEVGMRGVQCLGFGVWLAIVGCSTESDPEVGVSSKTVAVVDETTERTLVIFTAEENSDDLVDLAAGGTPRTFRWISVELPAAIASDLTSENGAGIDLAESNPQAVFSQVYRDVCNPAADDFSPCWLYERYTAGEIGLSGTIRMHSTGTQIESRFSVQWEGTTDRFAGQEQWHRHETDVAATATIVEVTQ